MRRFSPALFSSVSRASCASRSVRTAWATASFALASSSFATPAGAQERHAPSCEDEARYQQVSATLRDPSIRPTLGFGIYRMGERDQGQGNIFTTHAKLELMRGPVWISFSERLASTAAPSGISHGFDLGYAIRNYTSDTLCDLRRTELRLFGGTRAFRLVGVQGRDFFWPLRAGVSLTRASIDAHAEVTGSFLWEPRIGEIGYTIDGAYVFPLAAPFDRPWLYASGELGYLGQLGLFTGLELGVKVEY